YRCMRLTSNPAKADMAGRGVDRLGMAGGRPVAPAVIRRTEMRATLQDLARDPDLRLAGVVAHLLTPAARVLRDAAGFRGIGFMSGGPPIGRPLPHIADHVVESVAVWRERIDGRGALVAIGLQVLVREGALPGIR